MLLLILQNLFSFILIISLIVFIHEFGHFYIARLCGVKVEAFAIGFGKEIFGFTDKKGTRWKFCLVPMGGYVKMFGDRDAASSPDAKAIENFSEKEKAQSFIFKNVWQRFAIVAAGPIANFILAWAIFAGMFYVNGVHKALPVIDQVVKGGAAQKADLKKGDEVLAINGKEIEIFVQMQEIVTQSAGKVLSFEILRDGRTFKVDVTPLVRERKNVFGEVSKVGMIGVSSGVLEHEKLGLTESCAKSGTEIVRISKAIFVAIGELVTGQRSLKELGGPIKIAKYSGKSVKSGLAMALWFSAMISLNLGVMNLLPLPVLDGGHLVFYLFEGVMGRKVPVKVQEVAFQAGFAILVGLMGLTLVNDLVGVFGG